MPRKNHAFSNQSPHYGRGYVFYLGTVFRKTAPFRFHVDVDAAFSSCYLYEHSPNIEHWRHSGRPAQSPFRAWRGIRPLARREKPVGQTVHDKRTWRRTTPAILASMNY